MEGNVLSSFLKSSKQNERCATQAQPTEPLVHYCNLFFLITACDKGTFGEGCKSSCHCLNGVKCHSVNGQCPLGDCDAGWIPGTCSEGK